jgi:hypothetical protein
MTYRRASAILSTMGTVLILSCSKDFVGPSPSSRAALPVKTQTTPPSEKLGIGEARLLDLGLVPENINSCIATTYSNGMKQAGSHRLRIPMKSPTQENLDPMPDSASLGEFRYVRWERATKPRCLMSLA